MSASFSLPSLKHRLISGGLWALSGKVGTSLASLAISALLARLLAPAELGVYFLTLSVVTIASIVARAGLDQTAVRLVAQGLGRNRPGQARTVVSRMFRVGTASVLLVATALWLGVGRLVARELFSSELMVTVAALMAPWVVVLTFQNFLAETFRGFHDIREATLSGGLITRATTVALLFAALVVYGRVGLGTAIWLSIAAGVLNGLIMGSLLSRKVRGIGRADPSALSASGLLRESWPLLITAITHFVITNADLWIVGAMRPEAELGIYAAVARLVLLVNMPLGIANRVLPPVISELYTQGQKKRLERVLRGTASLSGIPSIVALLLFVIFGAPILAIVFGEYYRAGVTVLRLLSLGQLANVWVGSCGFVLIMTGHQRTMMTISTIFGTLTVLGGLAIVNSYGIEGMALVVAAATIGQQILMLYFARLRTGVWTHTGVVPLVSLVRKSLGNR